MPVTPTSVPSLIFGETNKIFDDDRCRSHKLRVKWSQDRLMRILRDHDPESDGPIVDLKVLMGSIPGHRFDLYLDGRSSTQDKKKRCVMKPLLGRLYIPGGKGYRRIGVLVDSLREFLYHYNPDNHRDCDEMVETIRKAHAKFVVDLIGQRRPSVKSGELPTSPRADLSQRPVSPWAILR